MRSISIRLLVVGACLILPLLAFAKVPDTALRDDAINTIRIRPSETDPEIKTFDTYHYAYVNDAIIVDHDASLTPIRNQLLLWIPGTQEKENESPGAAAGFCKLAANLGYHVVILKYPNNESASACRNDADRNAFEKFRMALITGGTSAHLNVARSESIVNRLTKLLVYLARVRPTEHWEQFIETDGTIKWSAIAVAGQSQGGGHAALLGIKYQVARVICFGAPKDFSQAHHGPAAWLTAQSATPKARFFALNHQQDHQACSPAEQLENLHALGLAEFGKMVDVDQANPPYRHSHILETNYPGGKIASKVAHTTGINPRNAAVFGKVWTYLLTEEAP